MRQQTIQIQVTLTATRAGKTRSSGQLSLADSIDPWQRGNVRSMSLSTGGKYPTSKRRQRSAVAASGGRREIITRRPPVIWLNVPQIVT